MTEKDLHFDPDLESDKNALKVLKRWKKEGFPKKQPSQKPKPPRKGSPNAAELIVKNCKERLAKGLPLDPTDEK